MVKWLAWLASVQEVMSMIPDASNLFFENLLFLNILC